MDGLNRITDRIARDAEQEAAALVAQAREEAASMGLRFRKAAEDRREKILEESRREADALIQRQMAAAELEARKTLLSVKQALVSEVFEKALVQLAALTPQDYCSFLVRLAVNASLSGTDEILMNPEDLQRYGTLVLAGANHALSLGEKNAALTLSAETRPITGGLILKAGAIESNCSLEVLTALARYTMTSEVAGNLFDS